MSNLALFDLAVIADDPTSQDGAAELERAGRLAERLVDAGMGELRYIEELDRALAPTLGRRFDRPAAVLLRAMYEDWARTAEAVIERVSRVERSNIGIVPGADRLRDGLGRVMAMLSVTLEDIDEAREEIRRGATYSIAEVRSELRAAADR